MARTERTQMHLILLATALALVLLTLVLAGTATAAGPDLPEQEFQLQPIKGKIIELTRPIRCPDRMCPLDGRGCGCDGNAEPPPRISLPMSLSAAGEASSGALMSGLNPVTGKFVNSISPIRCPDVECPWGGAGCGCGGGETGIPTLTE